MAGKENASKDLNLIGQGTTVEGKIRSQGSVRVDGKVAGEITAYEVVSIGNSGEVDGNISAKNITIGGKVRGNVIAQEKLVFLAQATVQGDIRASKLVVDEGAMFDGKCSMAASGAAKPYDSSSARFDTRPAFGVPQQKH